ncbi:MAG: NAD+ kinase [Bacteroidia bacterium]|jgi:NAD+ kinase
MKIGLYARILKSKTQLDFVASLLDLLAKREIEIYLHENLKSLLKLDLVTDDYKSFNDFDLKAEDIDYLLSLGGDGTMLDTIIMVRDTAIPVLGVNMGRFGFLASSQQENIEQTIIELEQKSYSIDQRTVLMLESDGNLFSKFPYALNDFVIHKKDSSSMITVHTYLNGVFLNSYWADGLICSTPTGSSGYSLSCGGPLLFPGSSSLVITPIAPHNLNVRPAVISDDHIVSFEIEGRANSFLVSLDSRSITVPKGAQLAIKKAPFLFYMIRLSDESFMDTIRKKLMWGIDNRN